MQVRRDGHLARAAAGHDVAVADGALDDHYGVVEGALDLGDELLGAAAEDEGAGAGGGAALKEVEALVADLALLEPFAGTEVSGADVGAGAGDCAATGLDDAFEVVRGDAAGAKDVAVGEVSVVMCVS